MRSDVEMCKLCASTIGGQMVFVIILVVLVIGAGMLLLRRYMAR